jgi:hypothetical protein
MDSDAPTGRSSWKSSQAIKALLDQIRQTEIGNQSDDPSPHMDFVESESEPDSTPSSEEEPMTVEPIQRLVAKKKLSAKVVDIGDISDNDDGEVLIALNCYNFRLMHI